MRLFKFLAVVALLIAARPASAQFTTENAASVGYCEGCQSGNVVLVMDGGQLVAQGLALDLDSGLWLGTGSVQYARNGIVVNESSAVIKVHMIPSPCGDCLISQFPDQIDAYSNDGSWILSASKIRFDLSHPDPSATYASTSIGKLPASLKRTRRPPASTSLGAVKNEYSRTVSGRIVRKG